MPQLLMNNILLRKWLFVAESKPKVSEPNNHLANTVAIKHTR